MKIVHCKYGFPMGGAETLLVDLVNRQIQQHEVYIIIINDLFNQRLAQQIDPRVKIIKLNRKAGSRNPWFILQLHWLLWVKIRPEVLHIHSDSLPAILLYPKRRLFTTIHTMGIPTTYYHRFHRLFAISQAVYDDVVERRSDIRERMLVASNGVCCEKISQRKSSEYWKGRLEIIQVSRFYIDIKGQDVLVEAVRILKEEYKIQVHLTFVGDGPDKSRMEALVREYGLEQDIQFEGEWSREVVYRALKDYDLFVQPSRVEGFGLTVAEAMAAKVPVLVSDIHGPMEIIKGGQYGYYFTMGDAHSLAQKIQNIQLNYTTALEQAESAYHYVQEQYSITKMAKTYEQYYQNHT